MICYLFKKETNQNYILNEKIIIHISLYNLYKKSLESYNTRDQLGNKKNICSLCEDLYSYICYLCIFDNCCCNFV